MTWGVKNMDWIVNNVSWIFSGIGLLFISGIVLLFKYVKKSLTSKNTILLKKREDCIGMTNAIRYATDELFISGILLHSLFSVATLIEQRTDLRKIRLLFLDTGDKNLLKAYEDMRGAPMEVKSFEHLRRYLRMPNVEIRKIDSIMPVMFFAADMNKPSGYIKAEHFFNDRRNHSSPTFPNIEFKTDNKEWYDIYNAQIEVIWKRGKPWDGRTNDGITSPATPP